MDSEPTPSVSIETLMQALGKTPEGAYVIDARALRDFQMDALHLSSGPEVFALVRDLLKFASFMHSRAGGEAVARATLTMTEPLLDLLEELATSDPEASAERAQSLRKLLRAEQDKNEDKRAAAAALAPSRSSGFTLRGKG